MISEKAKISEHPYYIVIKEGFILCNKALTAETLDDYLIVTTRDIRKATPFYMNNNAASELATLLVKKCSAGNYYAVMSCYVK